MLAQFLPALVALWAVVFVLWRTRPPLRSGRRPGPLRVALFSGNYNCVADGANQALNKLVDHLERTRGAEVRVYSPVASAGAFVPAGRLVPVPSIPFPGRPEYRFSLGLPAWLKTDMLRFAPDIVHLSAPDLLGEAAGRLARSHRIPIVASLHTRFERYCDFYHLGWLRRWVERRLHRFYNGADCVLVPTEAIAAEMRADGISGQLRVWGRGVDRQRFSPAHRDPDWRRARGYDEDEIIVLFLGRLVREKGLDIFAQSVDELRRRSRRLRPLVVGDGPARDWFATRLGNAVFAGHLSGDELGRAVASADILINPSITEAFGNVNLEAMAAGLAVISADMPSASSLIDHGRTGLLAPATDARAYADAAERLICEPALRHSLGAAAAAESARFEWPKLLDDVVLAYAETLRRAGRFWPRRAGAPATINALRPSR